MPPIPQSDYNPIILGFVANEGYVDIPLLRAREEYGQLPSEYGLVPNTANRRQRKTLNLSLGLSILKHLREGTRLTETMARFYERWGRDYRSDYGVDLEPFVRRNQPSVLKRVIDENAAELAERRQTDIREYFRAQGLIAQSTLLSIPSQELLAKARTILAKKTRNPAHTPDHEALAEALALIQTRQLLDELAVLTGGEITTFGKARLAFHADEVARILWRLSSWMPLSGVERLSCVRGEGVEFEFAPRNASFLELGKEVGDCTADKSFRQVDRDIENIYWTVFSWFLDRQYQILRVYYRGQFVMKVHLLPLLVFNRDTEAVFLAVDAIETTPVFREDTRIGRAELLDMKEHIFSRTVGEVARIAGAMGIANVYAEKFSNTRWVRQELEGFPEIYLRIGDIRKIDELEDVFELAKRVCGAAGEEAPSSVFMELQAKNTYLLPGVATVKGVKALAVLSGDSGPGIPMKRVVGI
jgi:hypothetical protein